MAIMHGAPEDEDEGRIAFPRLENCRGDVEGKAHTHMYI